MKTTTSNITISNKKNKKFTQTKIYFSQGVISNIYSQLLTSLGDFCGVMLGNYKEFNIIKTIDSNANIEENNLNIIIHKVFFIYDKYYTDLNGIKTLFSKITENESDQQILGNKFFVCNFFYFSRNFICKKIFFHKYFCKGSKFF